MPAYPSFEQIIAKFRELSLQFQLTLARDGSAALSSVMIPASPRRTAFDDGGEN